MKPISRKRLEHILKNRNTEKYRNWRQLVMTRDENRCQYPRCEKTEKLEIHHIRTYAKNPHLKTAVYNGVTLCHWCHKKIQGNERAYEMMFFQIVKANAKRQKNKDNI